jgi:hypothetical protein
VSPWLLGGRYGWYRSYGTMPDDETTEKAGRPPEILQFTAAGFQMVGSAWVLQIVLSDIDPLASQAARAPVEVPRISIGLPWSLAKAILRVLQDNIEEYEKTQGPVTIPKAIAASIDEQIAARRSH